MSTEEGNILIAEFDGWIKRDGFEFLYKKKGREVAIDQLKYHTSWNWLMPVVEKIKEMGIVEWPKKKPVINALLEVDIKVLWMTVVAFILWYNTQSTLTDKNKTQ